MLPPKCNTCWNRKSAVVRGELIHSQHVFSLCALCLWLSFLGGSWSLEVMLRREALYITIRTTYDIGNFSRRLSTSTTSRKYVSYDESLTIFHFIYAWKKDIFYTKYNKRMKFQYIGQIWPLVPWTDLQLTFHVFIIPGEVMTVFWANGFSTDVLSHRIAVDISHFHFTVIKNLL